MAAAASPKTILHSETVRLLVIKSQVGFAYPRRAKEQHVLPVGNPAAGGKLPNLLRNEAWLRAGKGSP